MEMRHEATGTGYELNNFIRQQIGFDGRDAITFDAFDLIQRFYQIEKSLSGRLPEIADVHSRQHNLFSTLGGSLTGLFHQRGNRAVTAASARERNGAVRTKIVASILHFHEKTRTVAPGTRSRERTNVLVDRSKRSEEHTSELQSRQYLVCRLLLEKKQHIPLTTIRFSYHNTTIS